MNSLVSIHFIVQWLSPFPSLIDLILFFESAKHHASMSKSYTESCNQCLSPLSLLFYSPTLYLIGNSLHCFVDFLITKKINSYMLVIFLFSFLHKRQHVGCLLLYSISWKLLPNNLQKCSSSFQYSIVYVCHIHQSSVLRHVDDFLDFVIKNNATMNNFVHICFCIVGSVSSV